jgi:hypothetical protein
MRAHALVLALCGTLSITAEAAADVLQFECVGKESIYTTTFEEHQQNLTERPTTVQIELDRTRKTLTVSGTTTADGKGALKVNPASFDAIYERARVIYEVPFKYVQVHLPQARNDLSIIAATHLDLSEPEAEGRLLFSGICRLPKLIGK